MKTMIYILFVKKKKYINIFIIFIYYILIIKCVYQSLYLTNNQRRIQGEQWGQFPPVHKKISYIPFVFFLFLVDNEQIALPLFKTSVSALAVNIDVLTSNMSSPFYLPLCSTLWRFLFF